MGNKTSGVVIEKRYDPPPGAPNRYWCFLMVEQPSGKRVTIRLHQKLHDKIAVLDEIAFEMPWRKNKRVRAVEVTGRADAPK